MNRYEISIIIADQIYRLFLLVEIACCFSLIVAPAGYGEIAKNYVTSPKNRHVKGRIVSPELHIYVVCCTCSLDMRVWHPTLVKPWHVASSDMSYKSWHLHCVHKMHDV